MRKRLVFIIISFLLLSVIVFGFSLRGKYVVPILMYHHIAAGGEFSSLRVTPENFRRQMQFLARFNYNVITLGEFVQAKLRKEKLPHNTVVLTFDDGYADNYTAAFPVLKKLKLPATVFVAVNDIDREGYLNYPQIGQMQSSGIITIGSHTLIGDYLPGREEKEIVREISLSKKILEQRLNKRVDFFAYPLGGFSAEIQTVLKKNSYLAACTTNRGKVQTYRNDDLWALKRIKVKDSPFNLLVFWVKLSGYYNLWRRVRRPY